MSEVAETTEAVETQRSAADQTALDAILAKIDETVAARMDTASESIATIKTEIEALAARTETVEGRSVGTSDAAEELPGRGMVGFEGVEEIQSRALVIDVLYRDLPGVFDNGSRAQREKKAQIGAFRGAELDEQYAQFFRLHHKQPHLAEVARLKADDLLYSRMTGFQRSALEREKVEAQRAALAVGTADSGGGIASGTGADAVPVGMAAQINVVMSGIRKLRPLAQIFTTPGQQIRVPIGGGATSEMVLEGGTLTEGTPGMSTILLDKKKLRCTVETTIEQLDQSAYDVVGWMAFEAGQSIAALEEAELFESATPVAASVTEGIVTGATTIALAVLTELTLADMYNIFYNGVDQFTRPNSVWFASTHVIQAHLMAMVDSGGARLIFDNADARANVILDAYPGAIAAIFGRPIFEVPMPFVPSGVPTGIDNSIVFGDPRQYGMLDGGQIGVESDRSLLFLSDGVLFKFGQWFDGAVLRASHIAKLINIDGVA